MATINRIFPGKTRAEYDEIKATSAMNVSTLLKGKRSMAHLKEFLDHPTFETTPALDVGTATHLCVYEPSRFESRVVKSKKFDRRTTIGKEESAAFEKEHAGKLILDPEQFDTCIRVRDAVAKHPIASKICSGKGLGEVTAMWGAKVKTPVLFEDEKHEDGIVTTELQCKMMIDRFSEWESWPIVSDLKTTEDGSPSAFRKSILNYDYHTRAAFYVDGLHRISPNPSRRFFWIVVEKDAPNCVAVYEPEKEALDKGREIYQRLLHEYAECLKTGTWPGFSLGVEPINLPRWAYAKENA